MIELLIDIRQNISYVFLGLFGVLFISFFLFFKSKHITKVLIGFGLLFLTAVFTMLLNAAIKDLLRSKINDTVELALQAESKVLINGQDLNINSEQLLIDLTEIDGFIFPNKSSPQTKYLVSIIAKNDTLDILLRRDSREPDTYLVYLPNYNFELALDKIETIVLDGIN